MKKKNFTPSFSIGDVFNNDPFGSNGSLMPPITNSPEFNEALGILKGNNNSSTPENNSTEEPEKGTSLGHYHRDNNGNYVNSDTGIVHEKKEDTGKSDLPGLGLQIKDGKLEDTGWQVPNISSPSSNTNTTTNTNTNSTPSSNSNGHITYRPGEGTTTDLIPDEIEEQAKNPTPSKPAPSLPTIEEMSPEETYVPPVPDPNIGQQTYLNNDEKKNAFSYEDRKKYNIDWDSTKVTQHPSGSYIIKDGKGNVYITEGEGEGMTFRKQQDWRDLDNDGKVSFGEKLAAPFEGIYYGGKELVEGAKDLFTNPSDKTKKWAGDFKETANMWAGGGDKLGLTRKGEQADRNGDGEVSVGERFSNIVGDIGENIKESVQNIGNNIKGFNDSLIDGQVKVLNQLMKWGGYSPEQISKTEEGMKLALGFTNGIILTALNPIVGVPHLVSGIADYATSDRGKAAIAKNKEMQNEIYGPTESSQPDKKEIDDTVSPTVEEVADKVAQNLSMTYKGEMDADKMAMDAMARQDMEENGERDELAKFNELSKKQADLRVENERKERKLAEDKKLAEEQALRNWQMEMDELDKAEQDQLDAVGLDVGLIPHLRNRRDRDDIKENFRKQREDLKKRKPQLTTSDALLKTYVLRGIVNNRDKDPLKRLIQNKLLNSF